MSDPNDDADLTGSAATPPMKHFVAAQCDQRLALGRPFRDAVEAECDRYKRKVMRR